MASKQRAVIVDQFDELNFLNHVHVVDKEVPLVQPAQVVVNPYLRPINPTDHFAIKYGYWGVINAPPFPGSEGNPTWSLRGDMWHACRATTMSTAAIVPVLLSAMLMSH